MNGIHALLPIKLTTQAKQRLSAALPPGIRARLALTMAEDVLAALAATPGLSGIAVVTVDGAARALAARYGARVIEDGALDGHTGAVVAGARRLAADGAEGVLALPLDVPGVTPAELAAVLAAHGPAPRGHPPPSSAQAALGSRVATPPTAAVSPAS